MNKVVISGRLVRDPIVTHDVGVKRTSMARYTLAVCKPFRREGQPDATFVDCVAFGPCAVFAESWLAKGMKIEAEGVLENNNYERRDGTKVYKMQLLVSHQEFSERLSKAREAQASASSEGDHDFGDAELPF